jgi:hypothetical protein
MLDCQGKLVMKAMHLESIELESYKIPDDG